MKAPFPDIAAEAPRIQTEMEELMGIDNMVQDDPEPNNKEQAALATANLGQEMPLHLFEQSAQREVIKILDHGEEDILNEHIKEEILPKFEEEDKEDAINDENKSDGMLIQLQRTKVVNKQYEDYKLYVTVEDEEELKKTVNTDTS